MFTSFPGKVDLLEDSEILGRSPPSYSIVLQGDSSLNISAHMTRSVK